ncbi:MAG: BREX-1 system adenine-specific DNA-methyltransferase PglX, partial [Prolixibacteraceae bacterium]|nr:BREX-1 system adenine-specific DNA-methyltransferase PglX [Prolixibacteraceae bacterium]
AIQRHGVEAVVEEAAYTWFNRLMAMQILAKNNYDPTQLEYESAGSVTPVILARARRGMISYLDRAEQHRVQPLLGDYQNEQKAFAILLTGYCHHHQLLNRIFGRLDDYTELLLPDNILAESGLIYLLNTTDAITNEDYGQVELIGWLYQFYISEKKDQVFASFKKNQKAEAEDIPAATQIFTPNWIVKYMVQNTIGRIWLDHRPESPLRQKMKYLVESPDEPSSERSSILPPSGGLEGGLKLLDPACGSGHILVEGFFHLYDIYEEEYYMPAEAVEKILQHNLFGLDIDLRAAQLAQFAVLLAAATKYPDILKKEIAPHIYSMPEAAIFSREEILDFLGSEGTQHEKVLTHAVDLMQQAKNLGSVMQFNVTPAERQFFIQRLEILQTDAKTSLLVQSLLNKIRPFLEVLFILTDRYEAIAANPPYMGQTNMNSDLKNYINENFPVSRSDLMTVFMELAISLTKKNGQIGMINLPSWMFLASFEKLRKELLSKTYITSLIQNGRGIFGSDFGSVSFCIENSKSQGRKGIYRRLFVEHVRVDSVSTKEKRFLKKSFGYYTKNQDNFSKIPGNPISYWLSDKVISSFQQKNIAHYSEAKAGIVSGDDSIFIRFWHEISYSNIAFKELKFFNKASKDWVPINKGGALRRYFGNNEHIININDLWTEGKTTKSVRRGDPDNYYKKAISWSYIANVKYGFRESNNVVFATQSPALFFEDYSYYYYVLGLLNSKITELILTAINSTISLVTTNVQNVPLIFSNKYFGDVDTICQNQVTISRLDWDSHETSWEFQQSPLLTRILSLKISLQNWYKFMSEAFFQIHKNEEELNRIFIDVYNLDEELDPIIRLKDITILQGELDEKALEETDKALRKRNQWKLVDGKWKLFVDESITLPELHIKLDVVMKQLVSYAIGCMMGRYSLDAPGLILANQGETLDDYFEIVKRKKEEGKSEDKLTTSGSEVSPLGGTEGGLFLPDDDGIIPFMGSNCGFSDDAALRLRHFIEAVWGSESLTQNINFLQACLDMEIEKYLVNQNNFWKDHCSRYKKKPIYWLFSSKKGAFQVMVYMHRMNRFTVQKIRENYMFKHLQWLANQKADLERRSATLSRDETRQLDYYRTALIECQEYDLQLKNIADQQIEFDLDDGVSVNYTRFEPLLAGIK